MGPRIRLIKATTHPESKFVVLLRDPIERAMSAHKMHACNTGTPANNCTLGKKPSPLMPYHIYLQRWINVVGRARLHIVFFEDLVAEPLREVNGVLKKANIGPQLPRLPRHVPTVPLTEVKCKFPRCGEVD